MKKIFFMKIIRDSCCKDTVSMVTLASISYVVMSVFVLFCVGVDLGWVGKRVKEKFLQTSEGMV